ncbi:unnamed protein product [Lymnaea stagnalis]|uniref:LicD/FKTN/FKRP nucleotidyltransferase domain-containing protein n=1 Tax=Lymnaea stagnalis TaxID=6523 RepID=A0AAV2I5U0_LYMST
MMIIKFTPRIPSGYRIQSLNQRKPVIVLLFVVTLAAIFMVTLPVKETFFPYPLWKDVSTYQIIKMHLSARPTNTNRAWACPNVSEAGVRKMDLDLSQIQFYDDVEEKLKQLSEKEKWKTGFAPALSRDDKISLLHVYAVFKHALDRARLGHILLHGSAIGAWRHQGITPWDDDIDVGINVDDWMEVKKALSCISGFTLDASTNSKWSFFKSDGHVIPDNAKKLWPFLDIFLYTQDERYVWALNYVHLTKFVFLKDDMFPAQLLPFESLLVPVPRNLRKVLNQEYIDPDYCASHNTNHKTGAYETTVKVPCSDISDLYKMNFSPY